MGVPTYRAIAERGAELTWLWPGWLPFGNLSVLFAAKGAGKTHIALEFAFTLIKQAATWPDGGEAPKGIKVAYLDTEGRKAMICQRAAAAGIDLDLLIYPYPNIDRSPRLDQSADWKKFVDSVKASGARFVIVDSLLRAFVGDENKSREVGEFLGRLQDLAAKLDICILVLHHRRKKPDLLTSNTLTLDQARGSGAVVQYAAAVLVIEPVGDGDVSRLRVETANFVTPPEPLGFTLDEEGVHWCEIPGEEKIRKAIDEAKSFLRKVLVNGPVFSIELFAAAAAAGVKAKTLRRAKDTLPIHVLRDESGRWCWVMKRSGQEISVQNSGQVGQEGVVKGKKD